MQPKSFFSIVLVSFLFASCATDQRAFRHIDKHIEQANFEAGLHEINNAQSKKKPLYTKQNTILFYLDKGTIAHYNGAWDTSIESLGRAEKVIEAAFTKSISEGIASFILNDNVKEYAGEDYEDVYLNVFNALNYYYQDKIEDALVEVRRTNEKLRVLSHKYDKADKDLHNNYKDNLKNTSVKKSKPVTFSNSALADYLGAIFYLSNGDYDDARINLLQLRAAYNNAPNVYSNPIPASLVLSGERGNETCEELKRLPNGMGRLNILSFSGLSPIKKQEIIQSVLPFSYGLDYAYLKIPSLKNRGDSVTKITVAVDGKLITLDLLEDMGKAIADTFNAKLNIITTKALIRTIVKYTAVYIIAETVAQASESEGAGALAALAAKVAFDASESADIRMSRYLPAKAWIGAINLKAGTYDVTISYYNHNKKIGENKKTIKIKSGKLNLLEDLCLN